MGTLFFDIVVVPSSGRQMITLDKQARLKIFLKNPPEKGKANQELIRLLSEKSGLPQKQFIITKGLTDRKKRIAVATDMPFILFLQKLGIDQQINLL